MKRHPYPPTKHKRLTPYFIPLWWCVTCGELVRRDAATAHALRGGHSLVAAL